MRTSFLTGLVALQQSFYTFKLHFIEGRGSFTLKLKYRKPDSSNIEEIPATWLKHWIGIKYQMFLVTKMFAFFVCFIKTWNTFDDT